MRERDFFAGGDAPFEGELTLAWRSLPAGARITRASVTLTPLAPPGGTLFEETIDFSDPADGAKTLGATLVAGGTFVEVDFHRRRTLAAVRGSAVVGAGLQVELGGLYVEINDRGAVVSPTRATPFTVPAAGTLPGLTASKFKLTVAAAGTVSGVVVRCVPANVSVRLGTMAPFWTRPGEVALAAASPDFAPLLQAFLTTAAIENGFYVVPLTVHSDTLARLRLELAVEYLESVEATPPGLSEVLLPYDFATVPKNGPGVLAVALPPDARVVPGATTARVTGAFEQTRIVPGYGPTGGLQPDGGVALAPAASPAQLVGFDRAVAASAIDVLLTPVSRSAKLTLDLRADLDGKPDGSSLLGGAVGFTLAGSAAGPLWTSVALGKEFHFLAPSPPPAKPGNGRYWIVLQSTEGEARWNVVAQAAPPTLQHSTDGGLSWRAAPLAAGTAGTSPALAALFRLRYVPDRYAVPIELHVGAGERATRVKLDRFEALGRVDFTLDVPEVADGFNQYLRQAPAAGCSTAEHLANGGFAQWLTLGTDLRGATPLALEGTAAGSVVVSPDGQLAYAGALPATTELGGNAAPAQLVVLDALRDVAAGPAIASGSAAAPRVLAIAPDGRRIYVFAPDANDATVLHLVDVASRTSLGSLPLPGTAVAALVSPDGTRVYVASASGIAAYDAAALEAAARSGGALPGSAATGNAAPGVTALVAAPDGSRLFALDGTSLLGLDPLTLQLRSAVALGSALAGLALLPDGRSAVVAGTTRLAGGNGTLWVVDTVGGRTLAAVELGSAQPAGLTLSADGARAYVVVGLVPANSSDTSTPGPTALLTVDLAGARVVGSLPLAVPAKPDFLALAAAPQGNHLYVAYGSALGQPAGVVSIAIGASVPADWTAQGRTTLAAPVAAGVPVLELSGVAADQAASISQIVPVRAGCPYLFAFDATAAARDRKDTIEAVDVGRAPAVGQPDAVAELIWLGSGCGLARADREPVAMTPGGGLELHRRRVVAPSGAEQVEVRFLAQAGTVVRLAGVSLAGSDELLGNGDLRQTGSDGLPSGWSLAVPAARAGLGVRPAGPGTVRLTNAGALAAELVQLVGVRGGTPLRIAFEGRAAGSADVTATVEVRYLAADGTPAAEPTRMAVGAADLALHRAAVTVPAAAAQAEVHVVVPPATSLEIGALSLRSTASADVPLTFVAQSPGELRVASARVVYDRVAPPLPSFPATGSCAPTPPDRPAGDPGPGGSGYCGCCATQRPTSQPAATRTASGRPATIAACSTCGAPVLSAGGVATAPVAMAAALPTYIVRPFARPAPPLAIAPPRVVAAPPPVLLTDLPGVGSRRAQALADAGIATVAQLAAATPDAVGKAMRGMGPVDANVLVEHARRRIAGPNA